MIPTGLSRIDSLWDDPTTPAVAASDADQAAVGAIQDLLIGQGFSSVPGLVAPNRTAFRTVTTTAIKAFQSQLALPVSGVVDSTTLHALAEKPAPAPIAAQSYLALVLDTEWKGFTRLAGITAQFEAAGHFTAINRNTDGAGLSFGLIQWAQKPGRLNEILRAFHDAQPDRFLSLFGEGLLEHTAKIHGGVAPDGTTTDPAFDLTGPGWTAKFLEAGRDLIWQKTQIETAAADYRNSCQAIQGYLPVAQSERCIAFLLDVANQHGDQGLHSICTAAVTPDMDEATIMQAVEDESIWRIRVQFGEGNQTAAAKTRREAFRTSTLLSGEPVTV